VSQDNATAADVVSLQALLLAERATATKLSERFHEQQQVADKLSARIVSLEKERDALRASHERLRQELELFKRRLFVAKAERVDTRQLELEYAEKLRELNALAGTLDVGKSEPRTASEEKAKDGKRTGLRQGNSGTGRRDLRDLPLAEERIEIADPHLESLVAEGKIVRHGFEETVKLAHQRAGKRRVVIARVRYKAADANGETNIITTAMPAEMLPGAMATPSLAAHVILENIGKGLPLFRIEDTFAREGLSIDRGTLSRWKKRVGEALEQTVVAAMCKHARETAFCISTDATGVCVQPIPGDKQQRQPCKKAHFLVRIADRDHIVFDYLERETSSAIFGRFSGFSGYVQSDAKSVFDLLFADTETVAVSAHDVEPDGAQRVEVGCWFHCRKRFWEAAVCKQAVGREGLLRIHRIFELDASWKKNPPAEIKQLRLKYLWSHVNEFFEWIESQRPAFATQRGYVRTALEYAHNQKLALMRFFQDGRLALTNNLSERAFKPIATGRKAWLFCGSDDHAKSTAALFSLVASARLHNIEPEEYLRCLIRLVPLWPAHRMLELSPLFWNRIRQRLDATALLTEFGPIAIPAEPLDTT
jgi:transposase